MEQKQLGKNIRAMRIEKGLTQDDLAAMLETQREYISRLERGLIDIRFSTIKRITVALEISTEEIFNSC